MNFTEFSQAIQENVSQVIIGKADVTELMLVALLVEGHVLLEDVPGIGKTTLAKPVYWRPCRSVRSRWTAKRIHCPALSS
jgi:MoxR-like ATPase